MAQESRISKREARERRALERIVPFRVNTTEENILLAKYFKRDSGLVDGQYVANTYGFPFMPLPQIPDRQVEGIAHPRLVPRNATPLFFGHPIYWIDPKLVNGRVSERRDPVAWSIRMYLLLIELGLMDTNGKWTNAPISVIGEYSRDEIEGYFKGESSRFDTVWFTKDDLRYTDKERAERYGEVLDHIIRIQRRARLDFAESQHTARTFASSVLDNGDAVWDGLISKAQEMTWKVHEDANSVPEKSITWAVEPVRELMEKIIDHLVKIDNASIRLNIQSVEVNTFTDDSYSTIMSLGHVIDGPRMREVYGEVLNRVYTSMFDGRGGFVEDEPDETVFVQNCSKFYLAAVQRLRTGVSNFDGMRRGVVTNFSNSLDADLSQVSEDSMHSGTITEKDVLWDDDVEDTFR